MFEINNNLFGYINKSNDLTEDIIQRYKNSLIFIGDEKQIYVPAVNSYVGVGQSIINNLNIANTSSDKIYISDYANNSLADPNTTYYFPVIDKNLSHTYYYTYVALNVGVNPVAGKFIGGLQGTADYATVSDLTYKTTTHTTNDSDSFYVTFARHMEAESYTYVTNKLLYIPEQELLISTYFSGTLHGKSTYAEYAYHATYTTYTTYSLFNSYQSIHWEDNSNQNYHIPFVIPDSYSLSYIDHTLYYNPSLDCVYAGHFYGTFHGDTDLFESVRGGDIIINGNALIQENTYVKIGTKELGSGYSYQYIISYLDGDLVSTYENNLRMYVNINGIPITKDLTYLHATYLGNVTKEGLFTQLENTSNQNTRITIGGTTKDLQINADTLDGLHADDLLKGIRLGKISSSGNTLTQENTYVKVGNTELGSGYSTTNIINSANWSYVGSTTYIPNTAYNLVIRYKVNDFESTYAYIPKIYAYSASYIDGIKASGLFTQFETTSNQTTRITIAGTTKDLQIESYKTLVSQKTDNAAYPLVFTNATNSSGSGDLYKNYSNLLYNPYKQSLSSGLDTEATGNHSFATGSGTKANGENSVAEGYNSIAGGGHSHAEGSGTKTLKGSAHAEGITTTADGVAAHAEGSNTTASGDHSHAEGSNTTASGENSHASGLYTLASHINESAFGKYNASNNDTLFSVGIGTANNNRINAFEVTTDGKVKAYDGFYKNNSDNTYLLLGGGGHKLLTDLFTQFENTSNQNTRITIGGTTKDLQINADRLDGFHANSLLQDVRLGKLSSSGNTLTQENTYVKVGNTELGSGFSTTNIINSANWSYVGSTTYIPNTAYNLVIRYKVNDFESTYAYIPKIYAYSASYINGVGASGLFTQFENTSNQTTRITIGGTTKDLQINADKLDGVHASELFTYLGNENKQLSVTIGGTNKKLTIDYATESLYSNYLKGDDNRNSNGAPQWYMLNKGTASLYGELCKSEGATADMFEYRLTMTPYQDNTCGHPTQMAFNDNGAFLRTYLNNGAWNSWEHILTSGNSSISSTGSGWGSSITIKINDVSETLTIPGNPNTDYQTAQNKVTTNADYRLLLKWTNDDNDETASTRFASTLYYNPSTKLLTNSGGATFGGLISLQADQYTDSAGTGALNLNNSDIYGVNSIKFSDLADGAGEGLQWYRDATHVDTIWVKNGVIYFTPNRTWGGTGNNYTVLHSNNSSVSGGGNTWGSSITVKINDVSQTLTIPSNPNTDYQVTQNKTDNNKDYRLLFKYTDNDTDETTVTRYASTLYYNPSTKKLTNNGGTIYATTFYGDLSGNASTATTASKLGTTTVGGTSQPIYLNNGVATSLSGTIGSTSKPIYLNNGVLTECSELATSTHNHDGVYVKKAGDIMTGTLTVKTNGINNTSNYNQGIRINRTATDKWALLLIGKSGDATSGTGTATAGDGAWLIGTPASSNSLIFNLNDASESKGLCLKGHGNNDIKWNDNNVAHAGNITSKDATINDSLTEIATIAGVSIKAKITNVANYRLYVGAANTNSSGAVTNDPYIKFYNSSTKIDQYQLIAGNGITISSNASGNITITNSSTNTDYKVGQNKVTNDTEYRLLFKFTANDTDETSQTRYASTLKYNPSTKVLTNDGPIYIHNNSDTVLGINTTNYKIAHFKKDIHILLNNGSGTGVNDGYTGSITFGASNDVSYAGIYVQSSGSYGTRMIFGTTTSYSDGAYGRMIIDASGNVGIGTMSPSAKLHISQKSTNSSSGYGTYIYDTGNAWAMRTITILAPNLTTNSSPFIMIGKSDSSKNNGWIGYVHSSDGSNSNRLSFGLHSVDNILNIFGNGRVCIGTTTNGAISNGDYKLRVNGDVYASGFRHSDVNSNDYVLTAGGSYKKWTTNNTVSAIVARDSNGNISGAYYYSDISDENKNIDIGSVYIKNTTDDAIRRISLSDFISKITSLVDTEDTVEFKDKSLKVTEAWMDTGITTATTNFPKGNGTYAIQISHGTLNNGSDSWPAIYSGIMTIYNGTNGGLTDEVILHRSGHEGGKRLYLRTIQTASSTGYCKIQIAASTNFSANAKLTFKFRKLI